MTTATTQKWVRTEQPPSVIRVTRIAYRCGCTTTIGPWTKGDTPAVCVKHGSGVASVDHTTKQIYPAT